jgi:hypothetical protein
MRSILLARKTERKDGTERRNGKEVKRDEEKTVPDHDDACSPDSDDQLRNNR